jgi:hypothetical protein
MYLEPLKVLSLPELAPDMANAVMQILEICNSIRNSFEARVLYLLHPHLPLVLPSKPFFSKVITRDIQGAAINPEY